MRKAFAHQSILRSARLEALEPRMMMSSSPPNVQPFGDADYVLDYFTDVRPAWQPITRFSFDGSLSPAQDSLSQFSLAGAHLQTGLTQARAAYGLTGRGQTVAVIDTGIAFNHTALGGSWGARVVGGWDYAENDANPYDDGHSGSHGTHVAGIIGNSDGTHPGVAPGVDLVALRVFADNGSGYFAWVESALQWVYQNRNSFRNPITTVNLSLGAVYNGTGAPAWGQLEDEFQQLENVGIFVAVAAGNSFGSYGTPGLSYPGSSPYVVPVSAVDSAGNMASFSQRLDRVIAAPGVSIRSTVPDYVGNLNGQVDDWANYSGTSMASPYVAGAAVLIRQAMAFAGYTNITQDQIYNVMATTADWVYDPYTAQSYRKLNVSRALDSIMPADDYGSTVGTAYALGTIGASNSFNGAISRISDHDYFTFTAAASGTINFTATTNYDMGMRWEVVGGGGAITTYDSNLLALNVVAGQTYTIGVCTTAGVGYYSVNAQTGISMAELGTVDFRAINDQPVSGEQWYSFNTARTGVLTVEALYAQAGGNIDLKLYNSNFQLISTSATAGDERIYTLPGAGQRYYVQLLGTNAEVTLRVANVISQSGTALTIHGTGGDDTISFAAGSYHELTVNGVEYFISAQYVNAFNFEGGAGNDTITLDGTNGLDIAVLRSTAQSIHSNWYRTYATGFENVTIESHGGGDTAQFFDSAGNDVLLATPTYATLGGAGFNNVANGFARVEAYANSGFDQAVFHDSAGNETYIASPTYAALIGASFYNVAFGFDATEAQSLFGGADEAVLFGSAGNDVFSCAPTWATFYGAGWSNRASNFDMATARADSGGWDMALFFDSTGDDSYVAASTYAWLHGTTFRNCGLFFDLMAAYATDGNDIASLTDSIGNDTVELGGNMAKLNGYGFYEWASGFDRVNVSGSNGGANSVIRRAAYDFVFGQFGAWS
jgi:subtilisin family serine protease